MSKYILSRLMDFGPQLSYLYRFIFVVVSYFV